MKPMTKDEYELEKHHTNEERQRLLHLQCKQCLDPENEMKCPSCEYRYEKLHHIDQLLDGINVFQYFKLHGRLNDPTLNFWIKLTVIMDGDFIVSLPD